jgi:hypothetical protein
VREARPAVVVVFVVVAMQGVHLRATRTPVTEGAIDARRRELVIDVVARGEVEVGIVVVAVVVVVVA